LTNPHKSFNVILFSISVVMPPRRNMRKELAQLKLQLAKAMRQAARDGLRAEEILAKACSLNHKAEDVHKSLNSLRSRPKH